MASNTIASASLLLTADNTGLDKGLADGSKDIQIWMSKEQNKARRIAEFGKTGTFGNAAAGKLEERAESITQQRKLWDTGKMPKLIARQRQQQKEQGQLDQRAQKEATKQGYQQMFGQTMGAGLAKLIPMLGTMATGIGAVVVGATAAVAVFSQLAEPITKAAKEARGLGVGLEGLTSLQYAGKAAGASAEDVSGAVSHISGILQGGSREANRMLGQVGLDVEKLRSLPVDEAFAQIVGALDQVKDPAEKARLSVLLLGNTAGGLQPLLNKGADGIRALTGEAKATGNAFNEMDAEQVLKAQEAITRLTSLFTGLMNQAVVAAAPWIEWGVSVARTVLVTVGGALQQFGTWVNEYIIQPLGSILGPVTEVAGVIGGNLFTGLQSFGAGVQQYVIGPLLTFSAPVVDVFTNLGSLVGEWATTAGVAVSGWAGDVATWCGTAAESVASWSSLATEAVMAWASSVAEEATPIVTSALEAIEPYTTALSDYFWFAYEQVAGAVSAMASALVDGLGAALDAMGIDSQAVFSGIQQGVQNLTSYLVKAWEWVKGLWDYIGRKTKAGDALRDAGKGMTEGQAPKVDVDPSGAEEKGKTAGEAIGRGISQGMKGAAGKGLTEHMTKVLDSANQLEAELKKMSTTIGLSGPMAKIRELEDKGLGKEQVGRLREMAEEARKLEAGWGQVQEFDPSQQFDRQLEGLKKLRAEGRITEDQYLRGVVKSQKDLIAAAGGSEIKTTGGAAAGSQAAVSAIIKSDLQTRVNNDPVAEMRRAQKEVAEIQRAQLEVAKKTLAALEKPEAEEDF